jgi:hypothetical protein
VREASIEFDGRSSWLRVIAGRDDGWPAKELAAVLHLGGENREFAIVGRDAKIEGADIAYRLTEDLLGHMIEKLADCGALDVDVVSGFALIRPPGSRV